jgi:hypothetical protein
LPRRSQYPWIPYGPQVAALAPAIRAVESYAKGYALAIGRFLHWKPIKEGVSGSVKGADGGAELKGGAGPVTATSLMINTSASAEHRKNL